MITMVYTLPARTMHSIVWTGSRRSTQAKPLFPYTTLFRSLGDAVLHQTLRVLGLVVLAVFRKVAVAAGFLDLLGQLLAADRLDRKSTRLNSSHIQKSRMPSSA